MEELWVMNAIQLRLPTDADIEFLLSCENDDQGMRMIGQQYNRVRSWYENEFLKQDWDRVRMILINGRTVGWIYNSVNTAQRSCSITCYLIPKVRNKGIPIVVMHKFLNLMFDIDYHHKVKFTVYGFNTDSKNNFKDIHLDGVLRDDVWYKGQYWNTYLYSILRDEWVNQLRAECESRIRRLDEVCMKRGWDKRLSEN